MGTAWGRHVEELALNSNLNHRGHITEKVIEPMCTDAGR